MGVTLIRLPQLVAMTSLSRSSVYARLDSTSRYFDPDFPRPIKLSPHRNGGTAWVLDEVTAWIESRITNRP